MTTLAARGEQFEHDGKRWLCLSSEWWVTKNGLIVSIETAVPVGDGETHPYDARAQVHPVTFMMVRYAK